MIERSIVQLAGARSEIEEALRYEQLRYWRVEYGLKTDFKIENIRFIHDPNWRESFFSIQGIRDIHEGKYDRVTPRVVVWKGVEFLFSVAATIFTGGGWLLRPSNRVIGKYRDIERRLSSWLAERQLRDFREQQRANDIRRSEEVMAIVRANTQAKRTRVRITVAGNVYKIERAA